jgi:hypothetical protein
MGVKTIRTTFLRGNRRGHHHTELQTWRHVINRRSTSRTPKGQSTINSFATTWVPPPPGFLVGFMLFIFWLIFFVLSYYVSLCSQFHVVMSVTISTYKWRSVHDVQHMLCCVRNKWELRRFEQRFYVEIVEDITTRNYKREDM